MQDTIIYESQKIVRNSNTEKIKIKTEKDVFNLKQIQDIKDKVQEHLIVIALNNKNYVDSIELVGIGSSKCIVIEPTDVLRCAILRGSQGIIVVHNHPSGDSEPSKVDIQFTNKLNTMASYFNLKLLDHIILGDENLSMKSKGYINENGNKLNDENQAIKELKTQNSKLINKVERLENKLNKRSNSLDISDDMEM